MDTMLFVFALLVVSSILGNGVAEAFVVSSSPSAKIGIHQKTHDKSSANIPPMVATFSKQNDDLDEENVPRRRVLPSTDNTKEVGVGRRGTLMTLLGGAMSLAASDALLGAAGGILNGGSAAIGTSSVYGIQWHGLYQRMAALTAKHEAAVASPELLSWISKSPAIVGNPQLRAWVAAQRVFSKSRQVMAVTAGLEEGIAAAGAVAAAAVATKKRQNVETPPSDDSDAADLESTLASATTLLDATSIESQEPSNLSSEANEETLAAHTTEFDHTTDE